MLKIFFANLFSILYDFLDSFYLINALYNVYIILIIIILLILRKAII